MDPTTETTPAELAVQKERREALMRLWRVSALAMSSTAAGAMLACGGSEAPTPVAGPSPSPAPAPAPGPAPAPAPSVPAVATNFTAALAEPWGMAFLPDGRILVTQKGGSLVIVSANGQTVGAPVSGIPAVASAGQGGLLDVALDPDFATDPWVYMTFSEPGVGTEAALSGTAVARGRLAGNALSAVEVIFRQTPKVDGAGHFGSRLVFRNDKTLFVTLGERQKFTPAQDVTGHLGKVVRINRDGTVPSGNATTLGAGARPEIWSYGHRNPQGAALHPSTGELWMTEHGPQGGDEVNISRVGNNYGWPTKSYGCNYGDPVVNNDNTACRIGGGVHAPGYVEPLTFWVPFSIAPSGLCFYTGSLFPEWQGNLFMGALAGQALWRLTLNGNTVASREALFPGARVRAVKQGPDGALYMLTDRIVRIAR